MSPADNTPITHSTRVAAALAFGLGAAFFLMSMIYGGPSLAGNAYAWYKQLDMQGIDVQVTLAHLQLLLMFSGIAGLAVLAQKTDQDSKRWSLGLFGIMGGLTLAILFASLLSVEFARELSGAERFCFSLAAGATAVLVTGFFLWLDTVEGGKDCSPYLMSQHLAGIPTGVAIIIGFSGATVALVIGLWLMVWLLPSGVPAARTSLVKKEEVRDELSVNSAGS